MPTGDSGLRRQVLLAFAVGVALRIAFTVLAKGTSEPTVDGPWYIEVGRMINQGDGMVFPALHDRWGASFHTAQHPPLFALYIAGALRLVGRNFLALRLLSGLLGAVGILVAAGLGREVGGRRLAICLAWLVALSPLVWINDAEVHSESAHIPLVLGTLWAAYRLIRTGSYASVAVLGAMIGITTLNRSEAVLLCVLLALPVIADLVDLTWARRAGLLAACAAVVLVVLSPWVLYNLSRFDQRMYLSTAGGMLPMANCEPTFYGELTGYTTVQCWYNRDELPLEADDLGAAAGLTGDGAGIGIDAEHCRCDPDDWGCIRELCMIGDEGAYANYGGAKALHYINTNLDRLPYVVALRVARSLELYDPLEKAAWDVEFDSRNRIATWFGLAWYYLSIPFAVHGMVLMRRRHLSLVPISAMFVTTVLAAALAGAITRYRLGFDLALLLPVGMSIIALLDRRDAARSPHDAPAAALDQSST